MKEPTVEERRAHEATHLPRAAWCDACVRGKSKQDASPSVADAVQPDFGHPIVQMDYMYMGRDCCSLVMIDSWTRFCSVLPVKGKTANKSVAESVVRFVQQLNYVDQNIHICMDSEPATIALTDRPGGWYIAAPRPEGDSLARQASPQGANSQG